MSRKPILLYIEPPDINYLPERERRSVALFCLEAAQYQLRHTKHSVLVHPVDSTLWTIPQASALLKLAYDFSGTFSSVSYDEYY